MGIKQSFNSFFGIDKKEPQSVALVQPIDTVKETPKAYVNGNGSYRTLNTTNFTGEKTLGSIGPIKNYRPQYAALRLRSWQAFYESGVAQMVLNKLNMWTIGTGLRPQSQPNKVLLEAEGLYIDKEKFSKQVEARFNAFCSSTESDYSGMIDINEMEAECDKNANIGGDVLVIQRYEKGKHTVQLIDGEHLRSPNYGNEQFPEVLPNGNKIIEGVEVDMKGQHVAYHVALSGLYPHLLNNFETERITARTSTGLVMAWLEYGLKMRIDNVRGLPLISVMLDTLAVLDRYKEATVASAEERQKIVYQVVHGPTSTGESPLLSQMTFASDVDGGNSLPTDVNGQNLANNIAATTNKQTFNMAPDSKLESLDSKNELYFKDFFTINIDLFCSTFGIPPDVAKSMYNGSYSASRAAIKDWQHTLVVRRSKRTFKKNVFNFFFEIQVLQNKIQAPGYLYARLKNDIFVVAAYRSVRWVGANVPHIDPLKEVEAERLKLGSSGASIPLTTAEEAIERLDGGEFEANLEQYAQEHDDTILKGLTDPKMVTSQSFKKRAEGEAITTQISNE
jgi:capsid protein